MANQPRENERQAPPRDPALEIIASGFSHAIQSIQGGRPALWGDGVESGRLMAQAVPRMTRARLLHYCQQSKQDLAQMAAHVLADALAIEPAILQLPPEDAAEELVPVIDPMWPSVALHPQAPVAPPAPIPTHPAIAKLYKLASARATFRRLPRKTLSHPMAVVREQGFVRDIGLACLEAEAAGIPVSTCKRALESVDALWHEDVLRTWMVAARAGLVFADWRGQGLPSGLEDAPEALAVRA